MTPEEVQSCIDKLPAVKNYTYSVAYDADAAPYILITGPNGWVCMFADTQYLQWAIEALKEHATP